MANAYSPTPGGRAVQVALIRLRRSANWFYWIAGLSAINTVIVVAGSTYRMGLGLGITTFFDYFGQGFDQGLQQGGVASHTGQIIATGLDLVVVAVFVSFGFLANRGYVWAFVTGMVLYALDGALLIYFQLLVGVLIHAYALFALWRGLSIARALNRMRQAATQPVYAETFTPYQPQQPPMYPGQSDIVDPYRR